MKKEKKENKNCKVSSIGGQALMEGVMMRGPSVMAMAVRSGSGEILLSAKRGKSGKRWYSKVPVIRGVVAFCQSLFSGVDTLMKSAEVSSTEEETLSKGWMTFAVILGVLLGVGMFILLPSFLATLLFDTILHLGNKILLSSLLEGVLRIAIFVLYLFLVSRIKDIRRTFMYHGAEHRTINCYEKGYDMSVENVQKCSTRHNRCGTTFLFFVMIISILIFSLANYLFSMWGITAENFGQVANIFIKFAIRIALLPLVAGLSYELLKFLAKLPDNIFTAVLRAPGLALQRLTTYPPTDDMAEVALISFLAVENREKDLSIADVNFGEYSISQMREKIKTALAATNADESEADWILCDVLKVKRSALHEIKNINLADYKKIEAICARRKNREPLWYILGYTDFYGNRIIVNNNVLIPRPETEILAEKAILLAGNNNAKVLDLCTGSGCIALAIANNTNAAVTASDKCEKALNVAKQNLKDKAACVLSDMFKSFNKDSDKFDIIVSNPPYIERAVISSLDDEVKSYEPLSALDGGDDGLDFYRIIAKESADFLLDGGKLLLEIGQTQGESVKLLLEEKFKDIEIIKDYSGNERIIAATKL